MKPSRIRLLLPFLSGVMATALVVALSGTPASLAATRYEDLSLFTSVLNLVRQNYVEEVDERRLLRGAIRGMLQELDPHSAFMDVDAYQEMQIDTRGEFHGLGIEITKSQDGYVEVVSPIEGTPADLAGIEARDQIVTICPTTPPESWTEDCRTTKNMTLFEAVQLMRGRKGSEITVHIFREGFERPQPFKIVRDVVQVVSIDGRMLDSGYAYLRVRAFQERTAIELRKKIRALREKNGEPFSGMILDLRDNPGGLLDQAVKVADVWLDEGLIVYTQGRDESQRQDYRARVAETDVDYPMVVIANAGSASASEIVAGALQDQHRALVLGVGTFGKGSVQTVYPLDDDSGLRLTTARYYTPSGRSIQEVGIEPDIVVRPADAPDSNGEGPQRTRERDLEGHLINEGGQDDEVEDGAEETEFPSAASETDDIQLSRAVEVLKSWTYFDRLRKQREPAVQRAAAATEAVEAPE